MLKAFHNEIEGNIVLRVLDNLFFIAGAAFLLLGLLNNNIPLSVYGLAVMFISLYTLHFLAARHNERAKQEFRPENELKNKIAVLLAREKLMQADLKKTRDAVMDAIFKIKDLRFKGKVMDRFRAEHHAKNREHQIAKEDVRKALHMMHDFIYTLPAEQRLKFMKHKNYRLFQSVMLKMGK
ncbi:hypothetical protein HYV81_04500 [Candidatus Woesearchaeota archaeon]|nr:hypothetical protein [Candidatus Woesearchaeota archaeon]